MSPTTSSRRSPLRRSLSVSPSSNTSPNDFGTVAIIAVADLLCHVSDDKENVDPNSGINVALKTAKRSKRARSSTSSPSKKTSSPQAVKAAASRRTKKSSRKALSTSASLENTVAMEVEMSVPVLMDVTEAFTGFAYTCVPFLLRLTIYDRSTHED